MLYSTPQPKSFVRSDVPAAKAEVALVKQQAVTDAGANTAVKNEISLVQQEQKK